MIKSLLHTGPLQPLTAYGVAALAATFCFCLRLVLSPALGTDSPFINFVIGVIVAAWFGGLGPGLFALALSAVLGVYMFVDPVGSFIPSNATGFVQLGQFFVLGIIASLIGSYARLSTTLRMAEQERLSVTLSSIGDAVIAADPAGQVMFLNTEAERLTGWTLGEAKGRNLDEVFRIVTETTRLPAESPVQKVLATGLVVGLANHSLLIARDGSERPIDDSAAPIKGRLGELLGVVLVFRDVTKKRTAERALRESEERFRLLADSAPALIWLNNETGAVFVNRSYLDFLGCSLDEVRAMDWASRLYPEDVDEYVSKYLEAFEQRQRFEARFRFRRHDGEYRWLQSVGLPQYDLDGRFSGYVGCSFDVTDIVRAEQTLREGMQRERALLAEAAEANAKFRAFFEQGPLFAGILAVDGTSIEPNRVSLEACGYTREQIVGKPFWETPWWSPSPEVAERVRVLVAKAADGEEVREVLPYYVADGSQRVVDLLLVPIRDAEGQVVFLGPTGMDITDRRHAEEQQRTLAAQRKLALDAARLGWWNYDPASGLVNYDSRYAEIYGIDGSEKPVEEIARLLHPEDAQRLWEAVQAAMDPHDAQPYAVEYRIRRPDGDVCWAQAHGLATFDGEGPSRRVLSFVGTIADVTERKRAEESLREADRKKDQFLATLAHELRNPLAPISNALHAWPQVADKPELAEELREMMGRQIGQMVRLIDDLLDVSRITRGKIQLRKQRLDLTTVIGGALEAVRPYIDAHRHEVTVVLPDRPVFVQGDVGRLMQVFGNLLNNAAKYTAQGGRIWLTAKQDGNHAVVSIRDNGSGIPPEMLESIFEMFTQVDQTLHRAQGGLGIGLTLVRSLIEMHDGSVSATSAGPGQGSEFTIRLPIEHDSASESIPSGATYLRIPSLPPSHRVLVVDDVRASAQTLALMLEGLGQEARTASDGATALAIISDYRPQVAFLDIAMPGMDGYALAQEIRRSEGHRPILVALTGYGQDDDRRRAFDAGFDHHLVKPTNLEALRDILLTVPLS